MAALFRSPVSHPFMYVRIFRLLLFCARYDIVKWRADVGLQCLLARVRHIARPPPHIQRNVHTRLFACVFHSVRSQYFRGKRRKQTARPYYSARLDAGVETYRPMEMASYTRWWRRFRSLGMLAGFVEKLPHRMLLLCFALLVDYDFM